METLSCSFATSLLSAVDLLFHAAASFCADSSMFWRLLSLNSSDLLFSTSLLIMPFSLSASLSLRLAILSSSDKLSTSISCVESAPSSPFSSSNSCGKYLASWFFNMKIWSSELSIFSFASLSSCSQAASFAG